MPEKGEKLREKKEVDIIPYFCNYRTMRRPDPVLVTRSADRFSALGAEPRLQILRLLLAAHPDGLVAGEVQEELGIPASTSKCVARAPIFGIPRTPRRSAR
jgi:hypothetical protein